MSGLVGSKFAMVVATLGLFAFAGMATAGTISVPVFGSSDDAEENVDSGSVGLTSSDLELGSDGGGDIAQVVGMRFRDIGIPVGSTINSAKIQFTDRGEPEENPTNVEIFGQLALDPPIFTSDDFDISSRPKTTNSVPWDDIPPWGIRHDAGPKQLTPDFSAVVQEIVGQAGWTAGNAMVVIVESTLTNGERTAWSFDGSGDSPVLNIDFTPIPEPASVGLAVMGLLALAAAGWRRV